MNITKIKQYCIILLKLQFFGGEPLLQEEKILLFYENILKLTKKYNVNLKPFITTNGSLINENFIKKFEKLNISITLSLKSDHNLKRPVFNNENSFDLVFKNILKISKICDQKKYKLSIRYNIDHNNIKEFEFFISLLKLNNIDCIIETAYLEEFDGVDDYKNLLSVNDFKKWNSSKGIDILIKYGYKVIIKPSIYQTPCYGYSGQNLKIYSNGVLGVCNADFPQNKTIKISDISNNLSLINELWQKKENLYEKDNCINCKDFFVCGGKFFCRKKPCEYGYIDLFTFLKTYIKYHKKNKTYFFTFNNKGGDLNEYY